MISRSRSAPPDLGDKHRILDNHEPSWWLRAQLDALPARWETSGVRACRHLRPGQGVGITALYRPDLLTCPGRCADLFKLDGPADFQCDRCHGQSDTLAGVVYDTDFDGMQLLVMFGLCPSCEAKELGR
jgi:hypothetical protein